MKLVAVVFFSVFLLAMGPRRSEKSEKPVPATPTPPPRPTPTPTVPTPRPTVAPTAKGCNSTAAGASVCCYCAYDAKSVSVCGGIGDQETCQSDENIHAHDCIWENDHCKSRFSDKCNRWVNEAGCNFAHIESVETGRMVNATRRLGRQPNGGFPAEAVCGHSLFVWSGHSSPADVSNLGDIGFGLAFLTNACQNTVISDGCATFGPICDKSTGDRLVRPYSPPLLSGSSISFIGSQLTKNKSLVVSRGTHEGAACSYVIKESLRSPNGIYSVLGPYPHACTFGAVCFPEEDGHTVACSSGGVANGTTTTETCCCNSEGCSLVPGNHCSQARRGR